MFVRSLTPSAVALFTMISGASAQDLPSTQEASLIEAHASGWEMLLLREQLRAMAARWQTLTADPDSAALCFAEMLPVAEGIADELALSTGFSRAILMRWVEKDAGLKPYFFPPQPEPRIEKKESGVWKFLSPLVPIILFRVVDRMLD